MRTRIEKVVRKVSSQLGPLIANETNILRGANEIPFPLFHLSKWLLPCSLSPALFVQPALDFFSFLIERDKARKEKKFFRCFHRIFAVRILEKRQYRQSTRLSDNRDRQTDITKMCCIVNCIGIHHWEYFIFIKSEFLDTKASSCENRFAARSILLK